MNFTSLTFVFLFPIVLILYWKLPWKYRELFLLAVSYFFYIKESSWAGGLRGQPAPNMKILSRLKPQSIKRTERGTFIVDFGQNMAGWVQMKMRGNSGDTIKIKYAEKLDDNGELFIANLRDAETEDKYVCSGNEKDRAWLDLCIPRIQICGN